CRTASSSCSTSPATAAPRFGLAAARCPSQHVGSQLGQGAALALGEGDVPGEALGAELVHHVDEAVVGGVHVGIVDLVRVAGQHDLGVVADAGDDRLH